MHVRIAAGSEVLIRRILVLIRAISVAIAPSLILIRPGLIFITHSLIAVGKRLLISRSNRLSRDDARTTARRTRRLLGHVHPKPPETGLQAENARTRVPLTMTARRVFADVGASRGVRTVDRLSTIISLHG